MLAENKRKRIESLYVLKAICAFFVISIHVPTIPNISKILVPIAGIGTPSFLCITGYLLYSDDMARELRKCKEWALKSFWLALVCNIIYALAKLSIFDTEIFINNWRFYVKFFVLGTGMSPFLWYLTALFQALIILYFIIKYAPKLLACLPFLFIIAFVLRNIEYNTEYASIYPSVIRNTCIITSLPFLATGYLIRKHQDAILKKITPEYFIPFILFGLIIEHEIRVEFDYSVNYFMLCTYPCIIFLFLLCIKYRDFSIPVLGYIGKKHSPNIYYFHGLFISAIPVLNLINTNTYLLTLGVYMVCLPISFLYNYISEKWKFYIWKPFLNSLPVHCCSDVQKS